MASIDEIIKKEINPFDRTPLKVFNFWNEERNPSLTVGSIHKEAIAKITEALDLVVSDSYTRTLILDGDSGSGKSYLLRRLKEQLNDRAFFAYIEPWVDSDYIWRHILRYTVDSLMRTPEGAEESQLLLWLKSLSAFKDKGLKKRIMGERGLFIHNLQGTYPYGMYQAKEFFGVLYDLTNPDLYYAACDWLRGDELSAEDLKAIGVKDSIKTETDAKGILTNLGKISAKTQPIVLCFDNLDNIPKLPSGSPNLQPWFDVNTMLHSQNVKNFLVILSIVKNNWRGSLDSVQGADKAGIYGSVRLKRINLEQAKALWETRLYPIHQQADPKPKSPIYPLTAESLKEKFPSGKTYPRTALQLGRRLVQEYKLSPEGSSPEGGDRSVSQTEDYSAIFKLLWMETFKKTQKKISKISQISSPERIKMVQEALGAFGIEARLEFLENKKFTAESLSYQIAGKRVGVVWSETPNMKTFCAAMDSCYQTVLENLCEVLYLIRAEGLGSQNNKGYRLFQKTFNRPPHQHISPHLDSLHYLAAYHSLVNDACSKELAIGDRIPNLEELQSLVRDSRVLHKCALLQQLGVVPAEEYSESENNSEETSGATSEETSEETSAKDLEYKRLVAEAKEFMVDFLKTQQMLGRKTLVKNVLAEFNKLDEYQINKLLKELDQENKIQIIGVEKTPEYHFVCIVPES
ncbi:MAG: ATP-binding protein [Oscillatoria sp. SIO1A7]|nr:ATP-binding protein [Oscillatoria sp. SIO1A7]